MRSKIIGGIVVAALAYAQTPAAPPARGMHNQAFLQMRAEATAAATADKGKASKSTGKAGSGKAAPQGKGAGGGPSVLPAPMEGAFLGVNLWRMRLAEASAPVKTRGLVHDSDPQGTRDWTPEHAPFSQVFAKDDHLRLSFESARTGYLYVINRDVYGDGTKSAPILIFPTGGLRGGDNRVYPGVPIEIPEFQDNPPTFRLDITRADQTGTELLMIVSPTPLPGVMVRPKAQALSESQVVAWERQFGQQVEMMEDPAMVGKLYTQAERTAAADPSQPLGMNDPAPLTLYYRPVANQPMLARAMIQVKK